MPPTLEHVDLAIFHRYAGLALPRHVSYPMPTWWHDLDGEQAGAMLRESRTRSPAADLSLYIHIPFCEQACRYCACTRIVQPKDCAGADERTRAYVAALSREIAAAAGHLGPRARVRHIHWGGGTPTYLSNDLLESTQRQVYELFDVTPDAEVAIELDPRVTRRDKLKLLRTLGFNRVSLGIQDFNPRVQEHVNRIQPFELVRETVAACCELGFESINFDLIYGLPLQTLDTVRETLAQTIELSPDRIAYYQYAQIPDKVAAQRGMDYTKLPDSVAKFEMYLLGQNLLTEAGYVFIGLDHFAKPEERLARALRAGTLQRNFQGMTTGGGLDLIGLGASAIGQLQQIGYLQNRRSIEEYVAAIEAGHSPVYRGKRFTPDDLVRQAVLGQVYCEAELRPAEIEARTGVKFATYFARELGILRELAQDGLVAFDASGVIRVTDPLGRILMRTIGAVFDAYLEPDAYRVGDRQYFSANA